MGVTGKFHIRYKPHLLQPNNRPIKMTKAVEEQSLIINLKKMIQDLRKDMSDKETEVTELKENLTNSRIAELMTENEIYLTEIERLNQMLREHPLSSENVVPIQDYNELLQKFTLANEQIRGLMADIQRVWGKLHKKEDEFNLMLAQRQDKKRDVSPKRLKQLKDREKECKELKEKIKVLE